MPYLTLDAARDEGGWCTWCGEATGTTRRWHVECFAEHELFLSPAALGRAIVARDGCVCASCGREGWRGERPPHARKDADLQLDHRVPLWAVAGLPIAHRRAFHAIGNLQLLCRACHKRKTSGEAAARAELRRREGAPLRVPAPRPADAKAPPPPAAASRQAADAAYRWTRSIKDARYGERCRIVERGGLGTIVVQFQDGERIAAHRSNVRPEGGRA